MYILSKYEFWLKGSKYIYFAHWYLGERYTMNHLDMQVPHRSQLAILILYPTSFQQMLQPDCKYSTSISCFPTLELLLTVFSTVFSFLISTLWNLIFLSTLKIIDNISSVYNLVFKKFIFHQNTFHILSNITTTIY